MTTRAELEGLLRRVEEATRHHGGSGRKGMAVSNTGRGREKKRKEFAEMSLNRAVDVIAIAWYGLCVAMFIGATFLLPFPHPLLRLLPAFGAVSMAVIGAAFTRDVLNSWHRGPR